ncbi:MAG: hypothetical protein ACF8PN_07585 [Phycisphaerales bacterium]
MPVFTFSATLPPRGVHRWWTGGGDYYDHDHFPQFDARPRPYPGLWPPGSELSPALIYKDFACAIHDTWPYLATYFVTVENPSDRAVSYDMRIYVP